MKYLILSFALVVGTVGLTGCQSAQQVDAAISMAETHIAALREELEAVRADAQTEAAKGEPDSGKLESLASTAEKLIANIEKVENVIAEARDKSSENPEDFLWELLGVGAGMIGAGGLFQVVNRSRIRNRDAVRSIVQGIEEAKMPNAPEGQFAIDKGKLRDLLANAGIISDVEAIRKEVKS